ncbi:uncharacterized protein [Equus asinus]|uniref:uncharacterized protein isoform X2 n=1 Tax=Equus asinus TaxID=9793 RepID=UPI001D05A16C|nr:uncharacterized protein LOC106848684 isoform X3 [Equus asinus]
MKDLFLSQNQACWQEHIQKEAAARVAWKINYGHKYPKEGPIPGKRLQQAPLRSALGVGPMPVTSSPDSKEERHRQKPEEKYPYPILSSWEYGWHVGGAMEDTRAPTYARSQPITKTFYIKNTVFHIPRRTDQLM